MRRLLTTGLLLLQVPALAHGLRIPYPLAEAATDEAAPIIDDSSPTAQSHQLTLQAGAAANKHNSDVNPAKPEGEGDLSQELTDLQALRAQIAQLADEIHARETWLADAAGLTASGPGSITDCDRPACIIRAISRKVKYAITSDHAHHPSQPQHNNNNNPATPTTTIPLPPWRGKSQTQTQTQTPTTPTAADELEAGTLPAWQHTALLALSPPLAVALLFGVYSALHYLWCCVDRRRRRHRRRHLPHYHPAGQRLPEYYRDEEEDRGRRGWVGAVVVDGAGDDRWCDWRSAPGVVGWLDEKEAYVDVDEEEEEGGCCWDEKGGGLDKEKESREDEDEGSVGGEIESFRSAVDWVESLIAEDEVGQGMGG